MARLNFLELAARKKRNAPENWHAFRFEVIQDAFLITGTICREFYSRGPRKGRPKWPGGEGQKVVVTKAEVDAEEARYERETGNCSDCQGTMAEWSGWSREAGHRYRPCRSCGATGKARNETAEKT